MKEIFRGQEIECYDLLASSIAGLREDFIKNFPDITKINLLRRAEEGLLYQGWRVKPLKLATDRDYRVDRKHFASVDTDKFPTAFKLMEELGEDCLECAYAVLEPYGVISSHIDEEGKTGKNINVHIPLIIPTGDVGLEAGGDIFDWSDIFAFDSLLSHCAWNYTDEPRIVFVVILDRKVLGLPDRPPWSPDTASEIYENPKATFAERALQLKNRKV